MRILDFFYEIKEGIGIALRAIRANVLRSLLTTLGVVIGIVSVTLMGTAIEGLSRGFRDNISKIGADVLYIQKWTWFGGDEFWKYRNRKELKMKDYLAIEKQATLVKASTPVVPLMVPVKYKDQVFETAITLGVNEQYPEVTGILLEAGRFFSQAEANGGRPVCVIGKEIADKFFALSSPIGKTIRIQPAIFRVIGVVEKQGSFLGLESLDNRILIPALSLFRQYGSNRGFQIWVKVLSLAQMEDSKEELRGILRKSRQVPPGAADDFGLNQQEMFIATFNKIGLVVAGIGLFITALSLFVGAIGIMNIMFVSVTERTKEIGIRKAIGAKRRTILFQFLVEAGSLSLMGGILGIAIAYPLSLLVNEWLPTSMPLSVVAFALLLSLAVGMLSGFLPAWRASKLNPIDALRYE